MARRIASAEAEEFASSGCPLDRALVDVLAAIHDLRDHKYTPGVGAEYVSSLDVVGWRLSLPYDRASACL